MARIAGVEIPGNKKIKVALTNIKGIGRSAAEDILDKVGVDKELRTKEVSADDLAKIRAEIDNSYTVEGVLTRQVRLNIKRLKDIGSYRGMRHERGLPVRGQRTKTNARTRKGRKQTVGGTGTVREKH
ncbi:MAG: 30S ribosomal protein S13 [Patescibacteria group bacterium]|nr:30S ribosomal protein S13 [Patescibacteria group bacterium]